SRCHEPVHIPLTCEDCAPSSQMGIATSEGRLSQSVPRLLWILERFETVCEPLRMLKSKQWERNIKFMIQYDRKNGKDLEKCMRQTARLLLARRTQKIMGRESMQLMKGSEEEVDIMWTELERRFNDGLHREGET
ncbi:hypothetical protein PENTCL1PPCAC_3311, partial [Pristionchus entomophagus]